MVPASLQDWFEIHNLFIKYTRCLDGLDPEGLAECFGTQASLDSPLMGLFEGKEGIREFARRTIQVCTERNGQFRHVVSNLSVEVEGNKAFARCYFLDYFTGNGKTELLTPGEYFCNLTRTDGRWLFDDRKVVLDQSFPFKMPGGEQTGPSTQ